MTRKHTSTAKAEQRSKERSRKAAERAARKAAGIPEPHQADNALVEAMAFLLTTAPVVKDSVTMADERVVTYKRVLAVALDILVRRFGCTPRGAAQALTRRLAAREEHYNHHWTPHHPSCEPAFWKDMSPTKTASPPLLHQDKS